MSTEVQAEGLSGGVGSGGDMAPPSPPVTLYDVRGRALSLPCVTIDNLMMKVGSGINSCFLAVQAWCFL